MVMLDNGGDGRWCMGKGWWLLVIGVAGGCGDGGSDVDGGSDGDGSVASDNPCGEL